MNSVKLFSFLVAVWGLAYIKILSIVALIFIIKMIEARNGEKTKSKIGAKWKQWKHKFWTVFTLFWIFIIIISILYEKGVIR